MFAILRHAFHYFAFRIADHARNKQAFKTWKSTELRRSGYPLHISRCFACKSVRWLDKPQPQLGCSLEVTPQELSFQHHRWRWSWSQGYWKGKAHCLSLASPSQSLYYMFARTCMLSICFFHQLGRREKGCCYCCLWTLRKCWDTYCRQHMHPQALTFQNPFPSII